MEAHSAQASFEQAVLPHLDAAYNLARWLTGDDADAEDVVQEACLRAVKAFAGFRGGTHASARAWLLTIVRNTCYTWLRENRRHQAASGMDDPLENIASEAAGPEAALLRKLDVQLVRQEVEQLPPEYREVIVLRELENLSYKEMADVCGVPIGTIMSRLARARQQLQHRLAPHVQGGAA